MAAVIFGANMTNEAAYRAIKDAEVAYRDAIAKAEHDRQVKVEAAGHAVGYHHGWSKWDGHATYEDAVRRADREKQADIVAAEQAKSAAISAARLVLHSLGERP
jgi:hypothetical protein